MDSDMYPFFPSGPSVYVIVFLNFTKNTTTSFIVQVNWPVVAPM